MKDRSPRISVVLTTYNRTEFLPRTLDSILGQTFSDFELIVSDDCSPDKTQEVCQQYAEKDLRVRYFRNSENLGMPGNLNAGIRRARSDYIANLHDGDLFRKDLLEKWFKALEKYPSAAFVFNHYEHLDEHGNATGLIHKEFDEELISGRDLIRRILKRVSSPVWGTVMARSAAYADMGGFDARFGFPSDVDMWMRLAAKYPVALVPEPLIGIRPRERHHTMHKLIWQQMMWNEDVMYTNLVRYFGESGQESERIQREFFRRWDRRVMHMILSDLRHRRWESLRDAATGFLPRSKSPRLAGVGKILGKLVIH
jgi:glycosyltransferase involved in cell wall biosynthesis